MQYYPDTGYEKTFEAEFEALLNEWYEVFDATEDKQAFETRWQEA